MKSATNPATGPSKLIFPGEIVWILRSTIKLLINLSSQTFSRNKMVEIL